MPRNKTELRELRIACIGGGSRGWVPELMTDLALRDDVTGHISLYDISYAAARENVRRGELMFAHPDARASFTVSAHHKIGPALKGADFVLIAIQPGPVTMMASDIDVAARYGVLHTVGDTAGPAGTVRALRTIPMYVEFALAIMQHCPDAWVMNCTNPMALCVATLYAVEPRIKAFGYCHEVFHTQRHLAHDIVPAHFDVQAPARQEINVEVAGVNHFTLARAATWRGHDLIPFLRQRMAEKGFFADRTEVARAWKANGEWFRYERLIAYDFLRRFGVFGASGDRHLVEFVPWYIGDEGTLHRWGVVVTPSSYRLRKRQMALDPPERLKPTDSEVTQQIAALAGLGDLDTNSNLPNRGQVPDLPRGAVIESNVRFRLNALEPRTIGPFPDAVNGMQRRIVEVHRATLEAGLTRDRDLAFQAILHDPLTMLSTDAAWKMFNEMLRATKDLLPGWKL